MSTLTSLHPDTIMELVFNREEQRLRLPDIPPQFNNYLPIVIRGMDHIKSKHSVTAVSASKRK